MTFYGVTYFAPVNIKVSRFHKEAIFLKTKTGIIALNVNEQSVPEYLFTVDTNNINYDFEVNHRQLLLLLTEASALYELQVPLRRLSSPIRRQVISSHFTLGDYDEVCSDRLFYIVANTSAYVINPSYRSVSTLFSEIHVEDEIISVDAVNIKNRELFFIRTKKEIVAYVLKEEPSLTLEWTPSSSNFNLSLSAYNPGAQSEAYTLDFEVLVTNETEIQPTAYFN